MSKFESIGELTRRVLQNAWAKGKMRSRLGVETGSAKSSDYGGGDRRGRHAEDSFRDEREPSPNWDPVIRPGPVRAAPVGTRKVM